MVESWFGMGVRFLFQRAGLIPSGLVSVGGCDLPMNALGNMGGVGLDSGGGCRGSQPRQRASDFTVSL